jgi:hypothetical protein
MRNYNTGAFELTLAVIFETIVWYMWPATSNAMYDAALLGTTNEELALKVSILTLFLGVVGFLLIGIWFARTGLMYFLYFAHDVIVEYRDKKDEGWL